MEYARQYHRCVFRDFNTTLKHVLRAFQSKLPLLSKQLAFMLAGYKMMKTVSRRWPSRFFREAIAVPYGARLAACDEEFFTTPGGKFVVQGYEDVIRDLQVAWKDMRPADKALVWDSCSVLLGKCQACAAAAAAVAARRGGGPPPPAGGWEAAEDDADAEADCGGDDGYSSTA